MTFILKGFFIVAFTFFLFNSAYSQYNETIRTGRPGTAIGPFTVGTRVFQIQAGTDYYENSSNAYILKQAFAVGSVFRFGITEHFEMSTAIVYLNEKDDEGINTDGIFGLNISMRSNVYVGKGLIPSVGFQVSIGLPYLSEAFNSLYIRPRLTIMTGQRIGNKFGFTTNWGGYLNGNNASPIGFYVLNLAYDINNKWGVFIEHFAFTNQGDWNGNIDGGASFLVNNNFQLDLSAGYGQDKTTYYGQNNVIDRDWFISAGLSWRVRFKDKKELE